MSGDPLPNLTAQQRKDLEHAKVADRRAADRAAIGNQAGLMNLVEKYERAARDRADEGGRELEGGRSR